MGFKKQKKTCKNCKYFVVRHIHRYLQVVTVSGFCCNDKIKFENETVYDGVCGFWERNRAEK